MYRNLENEVVNWAAQIPIIGLCIFAKFCNFENRVCTSEFEIARGYRLVLFKYAFSIPFFHYSSETQTEHIRDNEAFLGLRSWPFANYFR